MLSNIATCQVKALIQTSEFAPFRFEDRILTATLYESGTQLVSQKVNDKVHLSREPSCNLVFSGGKWGSVTLRCADYTLEILRARWEAYKDSHIQEAECRKALRQVPAGTKYQPTPWAPKEGDRVIFPRKVFGKKSGSIVRMYETNAGKTVADIACIANRRVRVFRRIPVTSLTREVISMY